MAEMRATCCPWGRSVSSASGRPRRDRQVYGPGRGCRRNNPGDARSAWHPPSRPRTNRQPARFCRAPVDGAGHCCPKWGKGRGAAASPSLTRLNRPRSRWSGLWYDRRPAIVPTPSGVKHGPLHVMATSWRGQTRHGVDGAAPDARRSPYSCSPPRRAGPPITSSACRA